MPAKKNPKFVKIGKANIPLKDIRSWRYEDKVVPILDMSEHPKIKQIGTEIVPTFYILLKGEKSEGSIKGEDAIVAKNTLEAL